MTITIEIWNCETQKLEDLVKTSQGLAKALFQYVHNPSSLQPCDRQKLQTWAIFPDGPMTRKIIGSLLAQNATGVFYLRSYSFLGNTSIKKVVITS